MALFICQIRPVRRRGTHQNDAIRVGERVDRLVHTRLRDRALDLVIRLSGRADSAKEDIRQRPVHGNALHDIVNIIISS